MQRHFVHLQNVDAPNFWLRHFQSLVGGLGKKFNGRLLQKIIFQICSPNIPKIVCCLAKNLVKNFQLKFRRTPDSVINIFASPDKRTLVVFIKDY